MLETDSLTIRNNFEIDKMYLVNEKDIWISDPKIDDSQYESFKLSYTSMNGPEWDTGITIDAFIELIERSSGDKFFLIARNQMISKIE